MDTSLVPCFELPLPAWLQQPDTIIAPDRKRKKKDALTDTEGETTDSARPRSTHGKRSLTLTPNETHQYRIAGLPLDQKVPGGRFPHAPEKVPKKRASPANSQVLESYSLRVQHITALTTVLHRCLYEGDFRRAGRAFGLLLRENFRGTPVDVRHGDKWNFGADILLRRGAKRHSDTNEDGDIPATFTIRGFAEAKAYYEKLILLHPYARNVPHVTSALQFYPAMFGLWIYVTQEESSLERKKIEHGDTSNDDMSDDELFDDEVYDDEDLDYTGRALYKNQTRISAIRSRELEQAQQIARRIDTLLGSPPYSDSVELLELRGMVCLWIGDLLISSLPPSARKEKQSPETISTDGGNDPYKTQLAERLAMDNRWRAVEQRRLEVDKAREFLEEAEKRGIRVLYDLKNLDDLRGSPGVDSYK
ncbi:hypothetical protein N7520_000076 [Penicillium odoratum]|uniref:uncharacterized protein n=1 Tax=Penicillium odoratum TaxID=1167516 RepID=UPI0025482973|nr:uncharacterized protein N7520_000076 [Penicillium odoratum]KAJ5776830.1 hypothetical protein N7520_000076 [Penicillium odoratum]